MMTGVRRSKGLFCTGFVPRIRRIRTFASLLPNIDEARSFKDRAMEGNLQHQSAGRECAMVWYELMRSRGGALSLDSDKTQSQERRMPVNVALPTRYAETDQLSKAGFFSPAAQINKKKAVATGRLNRYSAASSLRSGKTLKRRNAESY